MNKYVTDEINETMLEKLNNNTHYLILAGTGCGKTYFVKNTLRQFVLGDSKTMLVLTHRASLKKQTLADIDSAEMIYGFYDDDDLQVMNYQFLLEKGGEFLDKFDYIVCDEAHYFTNDSWNGKTKDEFELVKNSRAIKIYMTATYKTFIKLFEEEDKVEILYKQYGIDVNLSNMYKNIRTIYKTTSEDKYLAFIQQRDNKTLSIHSSSQKAFEAFLKLKESSFNCSKYNKDYSKHRDEDGMKFLEKNKKFKSKVLCSTTAIEGGVDIIDTELDLIGFSGYFMKDAVEQIAGRKRFNCKEDVLDFVVLEPLKNSKAKRISDILRDLEDIKRVEQEGFEVILEKRDNKTTIPKWARIENNKELTIDYTKVEKMKAELDWLNQIKETGISSHLAQIHGTLEYQVVDLDMRDLELDIFEKFLGKKMFKKHNKEIEEYIGEKYALQSDFKDFLKISYGLRAGDGGKTTLLGLKTINGFFEENNVSYRLENNSKCIRINNIKKKLTYWELVEII